MVFSSIELILKKRVLLTKHSKKFDRRVPVYHDVIDNIMICHSYREALLFR